MARFLVWSDLHTEFGSFDLPDPADLPGPIDGILIAGDTDVAHGHLTFAEHAVQTYDRPVVMVDGNHEYYHSELSAFDRDEAEILAAMQARGLPVHLLKGGAVEIAGTRIAGATLWTDYALDPTRIPDAMERAEMAMADFRTIKIDDGGIRPIRAHDILERHRVEKTRLWDTLATRFDGPTIVMTHHMPVAHAIHPQYRANPLLNAAFANNLGAEISAFEFDAWICGHSHEIPTTEIMSLGGPRNLVANPRGYPHEFVPFDPLFTIETG